MVRYHVKLLRFNSEDYVLEVVDETRLTREQAIDLFIEYLDFGPDDKIVLTRIIGKAPD